ncbi:MAG: NADP-dependent oxidoreductase [Gammaproteobacteria bacterium]|nr:NADP-dependent oxidoreductase [Gammaproteobacteria bacterium]
MTTNIQIVLANHPEGWAQESDFKLIESDMPAAASGDLLIENHWLSVDPYMRGRMSTAKSYAPGVEIGEVMVGGTVGRVIESQNPNFNVGDFVVGRTGWQLYALSTGEELTKISSDTVPYSTYLGVCGMPGATASIGLLEHCTPKAGETVLVSAASGAVGSVVGQLAKLQECRVVGIAGGSRKCNYAVEELGYDACVDYKAGNLADALRKSCPEGVDCYFENVGGEVMDAALSVLNPFSRVALCGLISEYNSTDPYGIKMMKSVLVNRVNIRGFIVTDHLDLYRKAIDQLVPWVAEGKIKYHETVTEGLENAPAAFISMMKGKNLGKQVVKLK